MQHTRTLTLVVLCVFTLSYAGGVLAANSVTDLSGRVWCVRAEVSPAPVQGQEIFLFEEEGTFGEFITMDKTLDASPHVFLTANGEIGIVWSRQNVATGRMEICSTVYYQESGLWAQPFTILTSPQGNVDHTEPRLEMGPSGTFHLVYVATTLEGGRTVSSLIYCMKEGGGWSEPDTISVSGEVVAAPELYLGASEHGYPLVVIYLSYPQPVGYPQYKQGNREQTIKALLKDDPADPDPWMLLSKHRLPINIR